MSVCLELSFNLLRADLQLSIDMYEMNFKKYGFIQVHSCNCSEWYMINMYKNKVESFLKTLLQHYSTIQYTYIHKHIHTVYGHFFRMQSPV